MIHFFSKRTRIWPATYAALAACWWRGLLLLGLLIGHAASAQYIQDYPDWQLAVSATNTGAATSTVTATATDASGNVLLAGNFDNTVSFGTTTLTSYGGGSRDIFVAKWSPVTKSFVWAMQAGTTSTDQVTAIAVSGSTIYLGGLLAYTSSAAFGNLSLPVGSSNSPEGFVAKLTDAGPTASFQWAQRVGSSSASASYVGVTALATGSGNTVYLTGAAKGTAQFGSLTSTSYGGLDGYVAKLTDTGSAPTFVWAQALGGANTDAANALAVSGTHVYLTGAYASSARFGSVALTAAPANGTSSDIFVARLTDNGATSQFDWAKGYGSPYSDTGAELVANGTTLYLASTCGMGIMDFDDQNVALNGSRSADAYLTKLTDTGTTCTAVWGTGGSGTYADDVRGLLRSGNNLYITGTTTSRLFNFGRLGAFVNYGDLNNTRDLYLAKVIDNGSTSTTAWMQQAGSPNQDDAQSLALAGNTLYLAGAVMPPAKFLPQTVTTTNPISQSTAFLASISAIGPPPIITMITPYVGPLGTLVTVRGGNMDNITSVTLNGQPLTNYSLLPASSGVGIYFAVTADMTWGPLVITTAAGSGTTTFAFCTQLTATGTGASRCGRGSLTLTAGSMPDGGGSYVWYTQATGGDPIAGATGSSYTTPSLNATTTYYLAIIGRTSIGCAGPRTAVVATVNPIPAAPTVTRTLTGNLVTLTSSAPTGNQWYLNGTAITGATGQQYVVSGNGAYTVTAVSAAGCVSNPSNDQQVVLATVAPTWAAQVELHPNPTTGRVALTLPATPSRLAQVRLVNALGQAVQAYQVSTSTLSLDLTGLARGLYVVQVQLDAELVTKRIVLE